MKDRPLRTSVIGSLPFPGWLEHACASLESFGTADRAELQSDAVIAAIHDQTVAGLDVITDGEQTRLDFNLSFYAFLDGVELEAASPRRFGPPAHDQRGRHRVTGPLRAPKGLGVVEEYRRLARLAKDAGVPGEVMLKASVPGPYTLSGRLIPDGRKYKEREDVAKALLPVVRAEIVSLMSAGCREICVDEPSMSCYAHKEDPKAFVRIFNDTVEPAWKKVRIGTHLCFGNYKGRAVGPRRYAPMFPAFLGFHADEIHVEMASREFAELDVIAAIAKAGKDAAVGVVDVKSYYVESPGDVAERVRRCVKLAKPDRLVFAPDCGLSQTARWASKRKLVSLVEGVGIVRKEMKLR